MADKNDVHEYQAMTHKEGRAPDSMELRITKKVLRKETELREFLQDALKQQGVSEEYMDDYMIHVTAEARMLGDQMHSQHDAKQVSISIKFPTGMKNVDLAVFTR